MSYLIDYPHHLTKYEGKGTSDILISKHFSITANIQNPNFQSPSRIEKKFESEYNPRTTFQNSHFESVSFLKFHF